MCIPPIRILSDCHRKSKLIDFHLHASIQFDDHFKIVDHRCWMSIDSNDTSIHLSFWRYESIFSLNLLIESMLNVVKLHSTTTNCGTNNEKERENGEKNQINWSLKQMKRVIAAICSNRQAKSFVQLNTHKAAAATFTVEGQSIALHCKWHWVCFSNSESCFRLQLTIRYDAMRYKQICF